MSERSDQELVIACRRGDQSAWEVLISRFQRLVYAIPLRAGLSEEDAAEVFQQSFVALFEHIGRLEDPSRVGAWLATTARRETWRTGRRQRSGPITAEDFDEKAALLADEDALPGEELERLEAQHQVRAMVEQLDDRCRHMLRMLFYRSEPLPYAEVAAELGLPEGSIGPTRARCLRKLRELLEKDSD